ncbi:hypothetical protein C7Y66_13355 [Chroococcidiopsis sp. CCALA 051]|nr:hypothetical protein C7Y66_13355 [Chroococcidiopsis sp. CCALA 051]
MPTDRKLAKIKNFVRDCATDRRKVLNRKNSRTAIELGLSAIAPLCLCLGVSPAVLAQSAEVISLKTLGYNRSIVLSGVNPEVEISVPAPRGGLDPSKSFMELKLEPSSVLNENSSVRLLVYGEPMKVVSVKSLLANPVVKLPIPSLPPGESYINVSIQPYLFITNDTRRDIPTGNLFLKVNKDSFFQITPQYTDNSIDGFFKSFYKQIDLVVPNQLNRDRAEVALWLYSVLAYQFREYQIPIFWRWGTAPATPGSAQVVLHNDPNGPDVERRGSVLRVRANPRAVQSLAADFYQPALVGRGLTLESVDTFRPRTNIQSRSFQELGVRNSVIRMSAGTQSLPLQFDLAQLGGRPQNLDLVLNATFTPTYGQQGERLTAQVYLNNTLIQSYNLQDKTVLKTTLALPTNLLQRTNNLEVMFAYAPNEGGGANKPTGEVIVQLDRESFLSWSGYQGPTGTLSDLPHVFLQPGQLVIDTSRPSLLAATAYLLGAISRLGQQPVFPQLVDAASVRDWSNLPKDQLDRPPTWRLMAIAPQTHALPAPVRLNEGTFEIFNPVNQKLLLQAQPTDPFGILQYFNYQNTPTLWLSWWGLEPAMAEQLGQALGDPRTLLASQLDGNVVTATDSRRVQIWDLGDRTLQVNYPGARSWQIFWQRYVNPLIVVGLILGGFVAWRIYQRVGRSPGATATAANPVEKAKKL